MSHYHAVVWIDHHRATVWQFSPNAQEHTAVRSHSRHARHATQDDRPFFEEVAGALAGAHEILILGPAQAKHALSAYLHERHPALGAGIIAVENADHPSDGQILDYARRHFRALDRMVPPTPR